MSSDNRDIIRDIASKKRAAVDETARRVVSSGIRFEPKARRSEDARLGPFLSSDRPPMRQPLPVHESLIGVRFGRFTVRGVSAQRCTNKHKTATLYVVECLCGVFELRRSKAILNPKTDDECCTRCRYVKRLSAKSANEVEK